MLLLVLAGRIDRNIDRCVAVGHEVVGDEPVLQFFAADVGKQVVVDYDAGGQFLSAALFHLGAEFGIFDDVLFLVRKIVLGQNGANAIAPAAGGFDVGSDVRFVHSG